MSKKYTVTIEYTRSDTYTKVIEAKNKNFAREYVEDNLFEEGFDDVQIMSVDVDKYESEDEFYTD